MATNIKKEEKTKQNKTFVFQLREKCIWKFIKLCFPNLTRIFFSPSSPSRLRLENFVKTNSSNNDFSLPLETTSPFSAPYKHFLIKPSNNSWKEIG